jgi:PLP dependent protein
MRAGGEDRRDEQDGGTGPYRDASLSKIVGGRAGDAMTAAVHAVRARQSSACAQHQAVSRLRSPPHLHPEPSAIGGRKAVVAEHHAAARRQAAERTPEIVAEPLVGEQPGPGVAGAHAAAIAAAMIYVPPALEEVNVRLARAARLAGREDAPTLIAVTKTKPAEAIEPLLAAGHRDYGENRVAEAAEKWPALRARFPEVRLHLIGQLQSNKAADAVALFDAIHSVDRPSLVTALARAMETGRRPDCFLQVNIGDEPQKGGCPVADLPALLAEARAADLPVAGLMCLPPAEVEAAPYFALLAKLARDHGLPGLSMGMSDDFETAAMLGATHVRVGSALFGARPAMRTPTGFDRA